MKPKMSEMDIKAKKEVLKELMQMCMDQMKAKNKEGLDSMKKVSVMAPDKESLEKGLDKAKSLLEKQEDPMEEMMPEMEDKEEESDEYEEPEMEDKELSDEDKKMLLKKLMK